MNNETLVAVAAELRMQANELGDLVTRGKEEIARLTQYRNTAEYFKRWVEAGKHSEWIARIRKSCAEAEEKRRRFEATADFLEGVSLARAA